MVDPNLTSEMLFREVCDHHFKVHVRSGDVNDPDYLIVRDTLDIKLEIDSPQGDRLVIGIMIIDGKIVIRDTCHGNTGMVIELRNDTQFSILPKKIGN